MKAPGQTFDEKLKIIKAPRQQFGRIEVVLLIRLSLSLYCTCKSLNVTLHRIHLKNSSAKLKESGKYSGKVLSVKPQNIAERFEMHPRSCIDVEQKASEERGPAPPTQPASDSDPNDQRISTHITLALFVVNTF